MELLLLSNSRTPNGYLADYAAAITAFAGEVRTAVFVPFAAVTRTWDEYTAMVSEASALRGISIASLHASARPEQDLLAARLIIVGGGNTFHLLHCCRKRGLLASLSRAVRAGARYLGWSAGANLACPTIKTTNDMPVVDPGGLEALGFIQFQINPHYVNTVAPGHQGETRDQRLMEYAALNPSIPVLGLPEGDWLRVSGQHLELHGPHAATLFSGGGQPSRVVPGPFRMS